MGTVLDILNVTIHFSVFRREVRAEKLKSRAERILGFLTVAVWKELGHGGG